MNNFPTSFSSTLPPFIIRALIVILIALLVFGAHEYGVLVKQNSALNNNSVQLAGEVASLERQLSKAKDEGLNLSNTLQSKEESLANASKKVSYFEKLRTIDPEFLKKYSKVYFLNENYVPPKLVSIDPKYLANPDKLAQIHAGVWFYLQQMMEAARSNNASLQLVSGYRSFNTQTSLKSNYKVVYGAGTANQFSADQGYSEHQLGTAVDLTTASSTATFVGFEKTTGYKWLVDNAYKYGFVLSYPPKNAYYQFEPWHWRFVGYHLAIKLHDDGRYFYDLDQRDIDAYLGSLFD